MLNKLNLMYSFLISAFLGVLAGIILLGTLIDVWEQANPYRELIPKKSTGAPQSMLFRILKCFSFVENGKRILNTDPPKDGSNHLGCLSGIRLVSYVIVICIS